MRLRLTILLACLTGMLLAGPAQAVIDGQPDEAHPYVGLVQSPIGVCSGALVSPTLFVTAAHCFPGDFSPARVFVGSAVSPDMPFTPGVARVHPGFAPPLSGLPFTNDVAVVQLMAPISMPKYASLPSAGLADTLGKKGHVTVVGYGVIAFLHGGGPPTPFSDFTRRTADIDVVDRNGAGSDSHLRLSPKGADACFGDSGGPNLLPGTDTILAVNSFSTNGRCQGSYAYRLDTPAAMGFLSGFAG
jgi:secreted trypsin-like serine protease